MKHGKILVGGTYKFHVHDNPNELRGTCIAKDNRRAQMEVRSQLDPTQVIAKIWVDPAKVKEIRK